MKFNSQICTSRSQSERLLALGLKAETADMRYILSEGDLEPCIRAMPWNGICIPCQNNFPAWSLHRLLCLLPTEYIYDIDFQQIMQDFIFKSQDMYDEVISCIETLIKEGYFNKEYLEE